jgi:hypothetical protein
MLGGQKFFSLVEFQARDYEDSLKLHLILAKIHMKVANLNLTADSCISFDEEASDSGGPAGLSGCTRSSEVETFPESIRLWKSRKRARPGATTDFERQQNQHVQPT